jgi:thioredoxin reductase (NADPH)
MEHLLNPIAVLYVTLLAAIWGGYVWLRARRDRANRARLETARGSGLAEPVSLHPVIDPGRCIGSGACVSACPEHDVLGLVGGKAELINAANCIGHGACRAACPMDAITLVFGTATRGVDIPVVSPRFETNIPGVFIAGELGGMGLVRNAVEQGRQAIESVRALDGIGRGDRLDVVIVGAGPAGFAASLAATEHRLRFVTVEQESLGGAVFHYPRGKIVMTAPVKLPIIGPVKFTETTKESLLAFWQDAERKAGLQIHYGERLEDVSPSEDGFVVTTARAVYHTRAVLLAIGRRGTPRKLEVPGEELPKVVYHLTDPEQYAGRHVLVVGGGDSALEAALSVAEEGGARSVALSYRGDGFARAKEKNRQRLQSAEAAGTLRVLLKSQVQAFTADRVRLEQEGHVFELPNDAAIVCAGGVLPTPFLKKIGIQVETKFGTA